MLKPRYYIDTSVIGGCCDEEFASGSRKLFEDLQNKRVIAVVSSLTLEELELAPEPVRGLLFDLPEESLEYVDFDEEAASLADAYINDGVVGLGSLVDAQQVAIATLCRVDVILSWNFKHIVNLNRIRLFSATNLRYGLPTPEIRSPLEVLNTNEEDI
jgi:hypothetical protein